MLPGDARFVVKLPSNWRGPSAGDPANRSRGLGTMVGEHAAPATDLRSPTEVPKLPEDLPGRRDLGTPNGGSDVPGPVTS
jgi:hypothetical protein